MLFYQRIQININDSLLRPGSLILHMNFPVMFSTVSNEHDGGITNAIETYIATDSLTCGIYNYAWIYITSTTELDKKYNIVVYEEVSSWCDRKPTRPGGTVRVCPRVMVMTPKISYFESLVGHRAVFPFVLFFLQQHVYITLYRFAWGFEIWLKIS